MEDFYYQIEYMENEDDCYFENFYAKTIIEAINDFYNKHGNKRIVVIKDVTGEPL